MCVHVNTLPDDCLLCIFDRIPLVDLLTTFNRVCQRWKCLFPSACARRHTLVLIGGDAIELNRTDFNIPFNASFDVSFDGERPYFGLPAVERDNSLTLPYRDYLDYLDYLDYRRKDDDDLTELDRVHRAHHSGQLAPYLTAHLPNIDKLVVIYPENAPQHELHSVIQLVGSTWSLKILKLWIGAIYFGTVTQYLFDQDAVRTLLQTIPQQSASLQKLTLDIDGGGFFDGDEDYYGRVVDEEANNANDAPNPYPLELYSFISQLKEAKLYLGCSDAHYSIFDIMHRFGSAQLVQNIGLGNDDDFPALATVLNPKFEFTTKVSQLYVWMEFETVELFSEFCGRFPALTSLWMIWSPDMITFTQLVNSLASLAQLTHLYLDIDFEDQAENVFALVDRVDGEERQISVLPRFKVLELSIEKRSHDDFESLSSLVFPSVEVIIMGFSIPKHFSPQCVICRPDTLDVNGEDVDTIDRCHRLMILSLKSKFTNNNLRLYAERGHGRDYKDWTDYVRTEEDALPVIGDDDGQVDEQPKVVEA